MLGTENLPGQTDNPLSAGGMGQGEHDFSGTCLNDSGADITIFALFPHMHRIGVHMTASVNGVEVFSEPFFAERQLTYMLEQPIVLKPGDKITAKCTYNNTTGYNVGFGESTDDEMCYLYTWSYPAGALDNGANSFIKAVNTCWGD